MAYTTYCFKLTPQSAFATPLAGDTLFGQLCWTLRHLQGNTHLNTLLDGYEQGNPFMVVGDALPAGYLPLPNLPARFWRAQPDVDLKQLKKKIWLAQANAKEPLEQWQSLALTEVEVVSAITGEQRPISLERAQPHNTLNRESGSTGEGMFAPFAITQYWFVPDMQLDLWVVLDIDRLPLETLQQALTLTGLHGYGKDASIGMGKFTTQLDIESPQAELPTCPEKFWLTLGPCTPQGLGMDARLSFYQTLTRFGRHGDMAVHGASPFKSPVLMAARGAVMHHPGLAEDTRFIGRGLRGVSMAMPETVHQGYAPTWPLPALIEACS